MTQRVVRLLRLYALLRSRGALSADDLAGALAISRRLLTSDIEILLRAGCPIELDPRTGRYRLSGAPSEPPVFTPPVFTESEALAVLLAAHFAPVLPTPSLRASLADALDKIMGRLDPAARERVERCKRTILFHIPAQHIGVGSQQESILESVLQAVARGSSLRVRYHDAHGARDIQMSGTIFTEFDGKWHIRGRSSRHRNDVEIPLALIDSAEVLEGDPSWELPSEDVG